MKRFSAQNLSLALLTDSPEHVAIVGGGGKTTLMYRLLHELSRKGRRAAAGTTTKIKAPQLDEGVRLILGDSTEAFLAAVAEAPALPHVLARAIQDDGKVQGLSPTLCDKLFTEGAFEYLVIEADGARRLPFKAPGENEPVVPLTANVFVAVVGLTVIGKPLTEANVFRPELVAAIAGQPLGSRVTPSTIVKVLASPAGLLKGAPKNSSKIVFLNQADDEEMVDEARQITADILGEANPWERVVIARLKDERPVEEIWSR